MLKHASSNDLLISKLQDAPAGGCALFFISQYYMGAFLSKIRHKKKHHLTTQQIITFLKDLNEHVIFDMLDNPTLLNKYKLRHIQQLVRLYDRNDTD